MRPQPRGDEGIGLVDLFVMLFGLRLVSEGIDIYTGLQTSVAITVCLIVVSFFTIASSRHISLRSYKFMLLSTPFILSACVSFAIHTDTRAAEQAAQIVKYVAFVLIFMVAASSHWTKQQVRRFFSVLILAMLVQLLFSIYQVGSGHGYSDETYTSVSRAFGLTSHPVYFGIDCVALLILAFSFRAALRKRSWTIFVAALSLCLALTFARSAWLMLLIWGGVMVVRTSGFAARLFIVLFAGPLVIWLMIASGRLDDLASIPHFIASGSYVSWNWRITTSSAEWRLVQWYELIRIAWENPWLGHGLRSAAALSQFHRQSHNSFIDAFLDQGFFGLVSFTVMLFGAYIYTTARLNVRGLTPVLRSRMATNRMAIWVAYIIAMNFGGSVFDSTLSMLIFFLFLGLSVNPSFFRHCEPVTRIASRRPIGAVRTRPVLVT